MVTAIRFINTYITHMVTFIVVRTLKIVKGIFKCITQYVTMLTIVAMLYIRLPELFHLVREGLYPLRASPYLPKLPAPGNHHSPLFQGIYLFVVRFHK